VAKSANVSIGTVSRVLTGNAVVSDGLKHQVLRAVSELGYHPNSAARNLRSKATGFIGFLVPELHGAIHAMYVSSAELAARQAGYNLVVGTTGHDRFREKELLQFLMGGRVDGAALLIGEESQPDLRKLLTNLRVPVTVIERSAPEDIDTVQVEHRKATRQALDYLLSLGHRRVALLTAAPYIRTTQERIASLREGISAAGLPQENLTISMDCEGDEMSFAAVSQILKQQDRPTAFLVIAKGLAGLLRALRENGLRMPDDVSVISLGKAELATLIEPGITTLGWEPADVGRNAIELILNRINNGPRAARHVTVGCELVIRGSCGRPGWD
jgi:LacI family transcriptional regulator